MRKFLGMEKAEVKYTIIAVAFAFIWFFFALPYLTKTLDGDNVITNFLVFNVGLVIFFQIFMKTFTLNKSIGFRMGLGLVILFVGLDTFVPEYHVTMAGELIAGATLGTSATDYMWGLLAINMGLTGIWVYIFTYLIAPIILLLIAAKILPNFVKNA